MTISMARWASAAAIGLLIALSGQGRAEAQSVMKVCADEYSQAKASGATNGETWQQFLQHCKTQQADAAAAPAPAPVAQPPAAPAPATTASSSSVYKQCQADWSQAKAPAAPAPQPTATATGAGEFTTAAQAKGRCPFDMVVWVNTKSSIYHYEGAHRYANTLHGAYMCEADAKATGHRAAANEKRPTA
jgi:hypothetical protein